MKRFSLTALLLLLSLVLSSCALLAPLGNGTTATFDAEGKLVITENGKAQIFYAQYSYVGVWKSANMTVELLGINKACRRRSQVLRCPRHLC